MGKAVQVLVLIATACVAAGVFGMLLNQLSYSVGPSYFHDLKFVEFDIAEDRQNRIGAALVGWRASWWMGLVLGLPVFGLASVLIASKHLMPLGIGALFVAGFVAMIGAFAGLLLGILGSDLPFVSTLLSDLPQDTGYRRAALMHEGAYLGGILGGLVALWTIWRARRSLST